MVYNNYEQPYYDQYQQYNHYNRRQPSIFDGFTLRPLPYPIILILLLICVFIGLKLHSTYEDVVESSESQVNWVLLATPLVLIFVVQWLSSTVRDPGYVGGGRKGGGCGGASPWVVGALIVVVLVLVQFQSVFLDTWFGG
ncbi:hypothetical protein vseg_006995 [Gypsophila vaccaria]